jgi:hypothetical protein
MSKLRIKESEPESEPSLEVAGGLEWNDDMTVPIVSISKGGNFEQSRIFLKLTDCDHLLVKDGDDGQKIVFVELTPKVAKDFATKLNFAIKEALKHWTKE